MAIVLGSFSLSVTLTKLVHRQRSAAGGNHKTIDLTPLFGPSGSIRVSQNVRDPSGTAGFMLAFADQISPTFMDTLYALVEPMDMFEIRCGRAPVAQGGKPPLLIRGFVSSTRRTETIASDGTPQRVVVITGQNAGKLIQQQQILWQYAVASGEPYLAQFAALDTAGLPIQPMTAQAFVQAVVDKVINPRVAKLSAFANGLVKPFTVASTVTEGEVIPTALNAQGSIWSILAQMADTPWNEMFVQDTEAGPVLVHRPVPFRPVGSQSFIMPNATDPGTITIPAANIVSLDVHRSDENAVNFFYVEPGQNLLNTNYGVSIGNLVQGVMFPTSAANDPTLYGVKMLDRPTGLCGIAGDSAPYETTPAATQTPADFVKARLAELQAMNQDNVLLEEISMVVRGSELLIPGKYVTVKRGATSWTAYLYAVDHTIAPLSTWTTSLALDRGDGFHQRDQSTQGWGWQEGRPSAYAGTATL